MDDPYFVTKFASKSANFLDNTNIEQIPVGTSRKNLKRELEIDTELECDFESNLQLKEQTLEDSDELFVDNLLGKHEIQDVFHYLPNIKADDIISALPLKSYNSIFIDIQALPSDKEKNPPYLVKERAITTNILTPVKFLIAGVKALQKIYVSMRYTDELHKNTAVKPCKLHQEWRERSQTLPATFNFYLTTECTYEMSESGHPTAVIYIQEGFIDDEDDFTFSVVFVCLNSCHRLHGKNTKLDITVYDKTGTSLLMEEKFAIRACRNVKRDHKVKNKYGIKHRCRIVEKNLEKTPLKVEDDGEIFSGSSFSQDTSTVETRKILFQMKSKEDEDLILTIIDRLKGVKWYP